jgi:hypothetical protein
VESFTIVYALSISQVFIDLGHGLRGFNIVSSVFVSGSWVEGVQYCEQCIGPWVEGVSGSWVEGVQYWEQGIWIIG